MFYIILDIIYTCIYIYHYSSIHAMVENSLAQVATHPYTIHASLACTSVWAEQRRAAVTLKYPEVGTNEGPVP